MMTRTGQVKAVTSRDFQSVKLWSFQLEGSDRYFRTGKVRPEVTEGQWIQFEEKNGIVQAETITDAPGGAEAASETAPATNVPEKGETVTASVTDNVGRRIQVQAARHDATRLVVAALEHDQLPHPSNVAKGKRLDLLLGYIDEVTNALLEQEDKKA